MSTFKLLVPLFEVVVCFDSVYLQTSSVAEIFKKPRFGVNVVRRNGASEKEGDHAKANTKTTLFWIVLYFETF